jgi:ArsR family transcriptional regulator
VKRETARPVSNGHSAARGCCAPRAASRQIPSPIHADVELVELWRALANAIRLDMVRLLADRGRLCAGEFTARYKVSQPALSHHLQVLRRTGLVTAQRCGLHMYYSLNREKLAILRDWLP